MDLLLGSLLDILSATKMVALSPPVVVLLVVAALTRALFLLAVALAFVPQCKHRMLKLLEVTTPLIRKSSVYGTRRLHERIAVLPLMVLAMIPSTAKTARRILTILDS